MILRTLAKRIGETHQNVSSKILVAALKSQPPQGYSLVARTLLAEKLGESKSGQRTQPMTMGKSGEDGSVATHGLGTLAQSRRSCSELELDIGRMTGIAQLNGSGQRNRAATSHPATVK
jgi:hypothetical protein